MTSFFLQKYNSVSHKQIILVFFYLKIFFKILDNFEYSIKKASCPKTELIIPWSILTPTLFAILIVFMSSSIGKKDHYQSILS